MALARIQSSNPELYAQYELAISALAGSYATLFHATESLKLKAKEQGTQMQPADRQKLRHYVEEFNTGLDLMAMLQTPILWNLMSDQQIAETITLVAMMRSSIDQTAEDIQNYVDDRAPLTDSIETLFQALSIYTNPAQSN